MSVFNAIAMKSIRYIRNKGSNRGQVTSSIGRILIRLLGRWSCEKYKGIFRHVQCSVVSIKFLQVSQVRAWLKRQRTARVEQGSTTQLIGFQNVCQTCSVTVKKKKAKEAKFKAALCSIVMLHDHLWAWQRRSKTDSRLISPIMKLKYHTVGCSRKQCRRFNRECSRIKDSFWFFVVVLL